jgi:hypothetical protein
MLMKENQILFCLYHLGKDMIHAEEPEVGSRNFARDRSALEISRVVKS